MTDSLRYFGFRAFQRLLGPFSMASRKTRMSQFVELLSIRGGERIVDLGGDPALWRFVEPPLDLTIVNLPGVASPPDASSHHKFTMVEGDACSLHQYKNESFDIAFSNSVIEHVGGQEKQADFAREVRRLARRYWVQTPSIWFPIEAHTGFPLWFVLPESFRQATMRRWRKKLPAWTEMVSGTTVIPRRGLERLFPDARFAEERRFGIVKSNIAWRK